MTEPRRTRWSAGTGVHQPGRPARRPGRRARPTASRWSSRAPSAAPLTWARARPPGRRGRRRTGRATAWSPGTGSGSCGPNSIEFVVAYFAALRAGFVAVPINPQLDRHERRSGSLADSGRGCCSTPSDRRVRRRPPVLADRGRPGATLAAPDAAPVSSPQDREALAVLLYTAGTSGEPKAAMLTHRALLGPPEPGRARSACRRRRPSCWPCCRCSTCSVSTPCWAAGLRAGARLVIMDGIDGFFDVVRGRAGDQPAARPGAAAPRSSPTSARPATWPAVTTVISGAAPLPEDLRPSVHRRGPGCGSSRATG